MVEERSHDDLIREQFSMQATSWDAYVREGAYEEVLPWIISNLELSPDMRVLDVAAGTGLVARAMSPHVAEAVATDATPEMVIEGKRIAEAEGLANVTFEEANARRLPYPDSSFSVVASRLAMHHFERPNEILREMARVCEPHGQVAIIDITTSEDTEAAEVHNRLERLRDPSHTEALPASRLEQMANECGLEVVGASSFDARRDLDGWMDMTSTPDEARSIIVDEMHRELNGGPNTGMAPVLEEGRLTFSHHWVMLVCKKP